ncbi:MAG: DUF3727 domain-containing protein [Cyanobacteria bacterium]|nr:DUF3727 domain-containing protein [Cyanobacteriota bacterium]
MSPEEEIEWDVPTLTIADDRGRSIDCFVEHSIEVEGDEYLLLNPVDAPVEIVTWSDEGDDAEPVPLSDDEDLERIFATARAVLAEENLTLKRSAIVLTVEGELPEIPDEEGEGDDCDDDCDHADDEEDVEEFQWLASFFHEGVEYAIYTPLDPFFILARVDENGQPQLLPPDEIERIEGLLPSLEERFFEGLD